MNFLQRPNRKGDKIFFHFDLGRGKGQRPSTGIFIYAHPNNQIQKNHNKQALALLETKKSEAIIEQQAIGSAFIPAHKFKENFLEYFEEYIKLNKRDGNRHLACCYSKFKKFVNTSFIAPIEITENFCKRFRRYLLDTLTGETPANYFARFKWVVEAATKDGYFRNDPTDNISAVPNPSVALKENLEVDDYMILLNTPWTNEEVSEAFIFCCYTGLRWVDVKALNWEDMKGNTLITRIIQKKTGRPVTLTLHPIAKSILEKRMQGIPEGTLAKKKVFHLPSANGANKVLGEWVKRAGITKFITWSCARLSYSILLQDKNVDKATVAYLLGHTTTKQVEVTYKRHRPKDQTSTINHLPMPDELPHFLKYGK